MDKKYLITGAGGQIGTELSLALTHRYGSNNVFVAGHSKKLPPEIATLPQSLQLDVTDIKAVNATISQHGISTIFHLAGVLSAVAESKPELAWDVNVNGLRNVLEASAQHKCAVFFPSSIGAFGPQAPPDATPQETIQRPTTIYGITKVTGEMLCDYYHRRHGVDTRGLRFPGLISYLTPPGGGTTDYAVDIFHNALAKNIYTCFLAKGTLLDMMYMPDAIEGIIRLMEANDARLIHRNAYNISAMSFAPETLAQEIEKHLSDFSITYEVDPLRQAIADSWPNRMDDSAARQEWDWNPKYDLAAMVADMITHLKV